MLACCYLRVETSLYICLPPPCMHELFFLFTYTCLPCMHQRMLLIANLHPNPKWVTWTFGLFYLLVVWLRWFIVNNCMCSRNIVGLIYKCKSFVWLGKRGNNACYKTFQMNTTRVNPILWMKHFTFSCSPFVCQLEIFVFFNAYTFTTSLIRPCHGSKSSTQC